MIRLFARFNLFWLALLCSLFFASASFAAVGSACSSSSYLVAHINGINTLKKDARHNAMQVLFPAIGSTYNGENVKVILAYNQSRDTFADLVDVLKQKLNEYPNVGRDLVFKALTTGVFGSALPQALQDFVTQYHIDKIRTQGFVSYNDSDLQEIVGAIRSNVVEGQKVVLVPHSQGNLYANAAYVKLTTGDNAIPTSTIKIVGIASPAAYVAGNGTYLTSSNDLVISALRTVGLSVLASNYTVGVTGADIKGHSMADVYMNPSLEGRAKVVSLIHSTMDSLTSTTQGSQGPITVTMTWGAQRDVDLHVYEPDGTHVFYQNLLGNVGFLDIDDTTSFGPEHYFTSCDNLKTGAYRVGVNYYSGVLPEIATVTFSTPNGLTTRTVDLPVALGQPGDNSPIIVGTINVTKDFSGRFQYSLN